MLHLTAARRSLEEDREAGLDEAVDALRDAERLGRGAMSDIRHTVGLLGEGPAQPTRGTGPARPGPARRRVPRRRSRRRPGPAGGPGVGPAQRLPQPLPHRPGVPRQRRQAPARGAGVGRARLRLRASAPGGDQHAAGARARRQSGRFGAARDARARRAARWHVHRRPAGRPLGRGGDPVRPGPPAAQDVGVRTSACSGSSRQPTRHEQPGRTRPGRCPARRRPGAGALRAAPDPAPQGRLRDRGRVRRRLGSGRRGRRAPARRRRDGPADARRRRDRGHPAAARATRTHRRSWSSPPSTTTSCSRARCGPARPASCSRTRPPRS